MGEVWTPDKEVWIGRTKDMIEDIQKNLLKQEPTKQLLRAIDEYLDKVWEMLDTGQVSA